MKKLRQYLSQVTFKNPVLVDLLNGEVYKLEEFQNQVNQVSFDNLPLPDYPFAIVERGEINFKLTTNYIQS